MQPEIKQLGIMQFVGCREAIDLEKGDFSGVETAWARFFALPSGAIVNMAEDDRFWGITHCTGSGQTYMAAKQVTESTAQNAEHDEFAVTNPKFAVFTYRGNPKEMGSAFHAAYQWVEQSTHELAGTYALEMYDSRCNPDDMDSYVVEMCIPVK